MSVANTKAPNAKELAVAGAAWRSVLVHVQPEAAAGHRLAVAADLARRLDATLIGVAAEMLPPTAYNDPYGMMGGEFIQALSDAMAANLSKALAAFKAASDGLKRQWVDVRDRPADAVERIARCADLIVAGGSALDQKDEWRWADPAELVLRSGRPVLLAPPSGALLSGEGVVVAWKDTRESRRALADALPLLKAARRVSVVEVAEEEDVPDAQAHHDSLLAYLERHGVTAESRIVQAEGRAVSQILHDERRAIGGDLIVAGAYGHTRVGEWVFGGVTADLLADPQTYLLLSH